MKTETQIKERISAQTKEKIELQDLYIRAIDKEQQNFYAAEVIRYDFMIMQLIWVLE